MPDPAVTSSGPPLDQFSETRLITALPTKPLFGGSKGLRDARHHAVTFSFQGRFSTSATALRPTPMRLTMVSTFPPRPCGIATFAASLARSLERDGTTVDRVPLDDVAQLPSGHTRVSDVIARLNRADVAIIQHEYGIYGGTDGADVVAIARGLTQAPVVVAHTVLSQPRPHQRRILEALVEAAHTVVVMSNWARLSLTKTYDVDPDKIAVIAHGATALDLPEVASGPLSLLTWGLLGPGKGIEWVIDALALLKVSFDPMPIYTVAGRTHPHVFRHNGERYRRSLEARARIRGVSDVVNFDPTYRDAKGLEALLGAASLVVLPYDSVDQVTSGVLVDAVAAGRPVLATAFPHAVELLAGGAGMVVPRESAAALACAIGSLLCEPQLLASMSTAARTIGPSLRWDAVGLEYLKVLATAMNTSSLVAK